MADYQPYFLKDVTNASNQQLFTVVSTFAGGGGSSTGYKLAGGKVLLANEINPTAVETYSKNYPDTPLSHTNIRKLTGLGNKQRVLDFFTDFGVKEGELDIFDGSPPCTTFSTASAGKGADKVERKNVVHAGADQSRIGMLVHDYAYLVNCLSPKVFVMENVVPSKKSPVFKDALSRIRKYGYKIYWSTVVASDCGVGQHRTRLITIGVRPDVCEATGIRTDSDLSILFPHKSNTVVSLRSALKGLKLDAEEVEMLKESCRLCATYELIRSLPKGSSRNTKISDVFSDWKQRFNSDFTVIRAGWNSTCPTLTCRGQQLGISGIHHPDEDRKFTIGELKRIMSLPDDFILTGTFNQKAERIGNMVPPLMTKCIADNIRTHIFSV